jgi:hypothetical protein
MLRYSTAVYVCVPITPAGGSRNMGSAASCPSQSCQHAHSYLPMDVDRLQATNLGQAALTGYPGQRQREARMSQQQLPR